MAPDIHGKCGLVAAPERAAAHIYSNPARMNRTGSTGSWGPPGKESTLDSR